MPCQRLCHLIPTPEGNPVCRVDATHTWAHCAWKRCHHLLFLLRPCQNTGDRPSSQVAVCWCLTSEYLPGGFGRLFIYLCRRNTSPKANWCNKHRQKLPFTCLQFWSYDLHNTVWAALLLCNSKSYERKDRKLKEVESNNPSPEICLSSFPPLLSTTAIVWLLSVFSHTSSLFIQGCYWPQRLPESFCIISFLCLQG